jgi:hypothetical protein
VFFQAAIKFVRCYLNGTFRLIVFTGRPQKMWRSDWHALLCLPGDDY